MATKRRSIPEAKRQEVFKRDRDVCDICGHRTTRKTRTVEHITGLALGGSDQMHNLRTAHRSCNSQKSDRLPTLWDLRPRSYDEPGEPTERVIEAERGALNNLNRETRQQKGVGFLNLPKTGLY